MNEWVYFVCTATIHIVPLNVGREGKSDSNNAFCGWDKHFITSSFRDASTGCYRWLVHIHPTNSFDHSQQTVHLLCRPIWGLQFVDIYIFLIQIRFQSKLFILREWFCALSEVHLYNESDTRGYDLCLVLSVSSWILRPVGSVHTVWNARMILARISLTNKIACSD